MTHKEALEYRMRNDPMFHAMARSIMGWYDEGIGASLSDVIDAAVMAHEVHQQRKLMEAMRNRPPIHLPLSVEPPR